MSGTYRGQAWGKFLPALREWFAGKFGPEEVGRFSPGWAYETQAWRYAAGAKIAAGADEAGDVQAVFINVPGDAWGAMSSAEQLRFVRELNQRFPGLKPTRIDVACDVRGEDLDLPECARVAHGRGERVGQRGFARGFDAHHQFLPCGRYVCATAYLGGRGKNGAGRLLRVYDKGLESGERAFGHWQRIEAELSDRFAIAAMVHLLRCAESIEGAPQGFSEREADEDLRFVALSCFDFREPPPRWPSGRRVRVHAAEPRVGWWAAIIAAAAVRPAPLQVSRERRVKSLERSFRFFGRQVLPTIVDSARAAGRDVLTVAADFIRESERYSRSKPRPGRPAAYQYALLHASPG